MTRRSTWSRRGCANGEADRAFLRVLADLEREATDPATSAKDRHQARRLVIEAAAAMRRAVAQRQVIRPAKETKPEPQPTGRVNLPPLSSSA